MSWATSPTPDVYKRQVNEILEALGEGGIIRLALGQRADLHGVIVDEGGLDQLVLHLSLIHISSVGDHNVCLFLLRRGCFCSARKV